MIQEFSGIVFLNCLGHVQSFPTLCDLMDYSQPGSSVHGILQARILEWVATSSSRRIFQTQPSNPRLLHLLHWPAGSWLLCLLGSPLLVTATGVTASKSSAGAHPSDSSHPCAFLVGSRGSRGEGGNWALGVWPSVPDAQPAGSSRHLSLFCATQTSFLKEGILHSQSCIFYIFYLYICRIVCM